MQKRGASSGANANEAVILIEQISEHSVVHQAGEPPESAQAKCAVGTKRGVLSRSCLSWPIGSSRQKLAEHSKIMRSGETPARGN